MPGKILNKAPQETPLYMAFPDGVFHYVCAECTALCCRGQGFGGSLKREMPVLLSSYPALGSAVASRQGSMLTFGTPVGRCFFLDTDNLCRIEKERGKDLKPGGCSLFPFNLFTRIGEVVAIRPRFLCPIRLQVPARPGHVEGTHATVEAAARESGLLDTEYVNGYLPPIGLPVCLDASAVIAREIAFRDACSRSLERRGFYATLREESRNPSALDSLVGRATRLLGLEANHALHERDLVDDLLLALAPSHRISLLRLSSDAILRALAIGEVVLRHVASLSNIAISPQGAYSILNNTGPAVRLLARGDETIELAGNADLKSAPFGDANMSIAAFIALRKLSESIGVLDALEKAIKPGMAVPDRSALLVQLGSQLEQAPLKPPTKKASKNNVASTA